MIIRLAILFTGIAASIPLPLEAKDVYVKMSNRGAAGVMVFEPPFVKGVIGDKIHFLPTDPGHNAEIIAGMVPEGITPSAGALNKEFILTLTKSGVYGIKCRPHFPLGMVALVQAGPGLPSNLAMARGVKLPALAARRMTPLLAQVR